MKKNKKVKISECCIITNDDKGQRSLVGKAKEALTTLSKNNIDVYIYLENTDKDAAAAFLKENNVPYKELVNVEEFKEGSMPEFDACILGENNIVLYRNDWQWTLNQLVDKLYDNKEQEPHQSEQQKMDDDFKNYKSWADQANKARAKRLAED